MMLDFTSLKFTELIPITKLSMVGSTLIIEGEDVSNTTKVFVNGISTGEFIIASKTEVRSSLPEGLDSTIQTVNLVGQSGKAANIQFSIKNNTKLSDSKYVMQKYFKCLFMTRGSDIFDPTYGAGIQSIVGTNISTVDSEIVSYIKEAEKQIIQRQLFEDLPSRLLKRVQILGVSTDLNSLSVSVSLGFEMIDGSTVDTSFNMGY